MMYTVNDKQVQSIQLIVWLAGNWLHQNLFGGLNIYTVTVNLCVFFNSYVIFQIIIMCFVWNFDIQYNRR